MAYASGIGRPVPRAPAPAGLITLVAVVVTVATLGAAINTTAALVTLAVAIMTVLVLVVLRWPHLFAPLVVVGFSAQPAAKFFVSPYFGPAKDVLNIAALAALVIGFVVHRAADRSFDRDAWLLGGLALLGGLYVVNPAGGHDLAWASATRLTIEVLTLFAIGYLAPDPQRMWRWAANSIVAVGVVEAGLGVVQQFIGTGRLVTGWGYLYGEQVRETASGQLRSFGTLDDPFSYAVIVLFALAVVCNRRMTKWNALLTAALLLGVLVSFVRTDMVLAVAVVAVAMIRRRQGPSAMFAIAAVLVSAGAWFAVQAPASSNGSDNGFLTGLNGRTVAWARVIDGPDVLVGGHGVGANGTGLARAAFGSGIAPLGHYEPGQEPVFVSSAGGVTSIDSTYLSLVSDVGVPGLLLFLAIAIRAAVIAARSGRRGATAQWPLAGIAVVMLLDGITRTSLTAFPVGFIGFLLLGSALAACQSEAARDRKVVIA